MRLIDLGDTVIDQFFVQLFLFLEAKDLTRLIAEHPGDHVEGDIVIIGIVSGDGVDRDVETATYIEGRFQSAVGAFRTVDTNDNRTITDGPPGILNHQGINRTAPHDALADGADQAARHRSKPQCAQGQDIKIATLRRFDDAGVVLAFGTQAVERQSGFFANFLADIVVTVGNDVQAFGDQAVMDIALIHHFFFFKIAFGKSTFHLLETTIMQQRRVGVNAGDLAIRRFRQPYRFLQSPVGIFRSVEGNQNPTQFGGPGCGFALCGSNLLRLILWRHGNILLSIHSI